MPLRDDAGVLSDDPAEAEASAAGRVRVDRDREARRKRQREQRQALDGDGVSLDKFFLDPLAKHVDGFDLRKSIVGEPMITRTIDGASNISVPVYDPDAKLLRSELLESDGGERLRRRIDVNVDGLWFRLDGVNGVVGGTLDLVFIARPVAQLIDLTTPVKSRREDENYRGLTRAEFGRELVRAVKGPPIGYVSPELHKRQPERQSEGMSTQTARGREQTTLDRLNKRFPAHGIADAAGRYRMDEYEVRLVCELAGMTPAEALGMWMVTKGESMSYPGILEAPSAANRRGGGIGLFQITPWTFGAEGKGWVNDLGGNQEMRNPVKAAIVARKLGREAKRAGRDFFAPWYGTQYLDRSQLTGVKSVIGDDVDLDDLTSEKGGPEVRTEKPVEFTVGPPEGVRGENYWEALQRLASDVNWRCFEVGGRVHFVSEDDLFLAQPRMTVKPSSPGVERIDIIDWLRGRRVQEVQITARVGRWQAPPGTTVRLEGCGPIDGKWLVTQIGRPVFTALAVVTLQKPERPKLEPPNEVETVSLPGPKSDPDDEGSGRMGTKSDFAGNHFAWPTAIHSGDNFGEQRPGHVHAGIDIAVSYQPVYAAEAGRATNRSDPGGYGTYLVVEHGNGWESRYAHLSRSKVRNGERVAKGQQIAVSGNTGHSTGPHLHFEIRRNGTPLNPRRLLP